MYNIGDHVRIVNLLNNHRMPVGIVESINGGYIYVWCDVGLHPDDEDQCVFEAYDNELVKVTEQEYFKLLLAGVNTDV